MADFPFLGGSFSGRSPSFDAQRTVNLYPELGESGSSRSPIALIGTPGLKPWLSLIGGAIRGVIRFSSTISIVIAGLNVWKVLDDKTATLIGAVLSNSTTVSMASNGQIIMMTAGLTDAYFINPTTETVTQITDPDFVGAGRVDFIDGYFVWNVPSTGKFQITQLYGTGIDALDFATAEGAPDNLVSVLVNHREIWLFGESTVEIWYDAGGADFPLQRIQGAFLECGCAAKDSVAKMDNTVFWLSTDDRGQGIVQRASGYTPQRVSNHAFEAAVALYSTISDALAFTYQQEGHSFYVISFPTAGATWCFDASNGLWHERAYRLSSGVLTRHRANCQMNFAGKTLVGDWETGLVYELDLNTYTDNGQPIERSRIGQHVTNGGKYSFYQAFEVFMQTGVGLQSGQGSNPQAMLRWSDDGGYTWSNERWADIGPVGARDARVRWRRLGKSRDRLFMVVVSDPIPVVMTGAALEATQGRV